MRRTSVRTILLILGAVSLSGGTLAQTTSASLIFGPTPPGLLPPDPARVMAISGLDQVDLYSGHVSVSVPLHTVGGRGDSGYTMTLAVSNPPWSMENITSDTGIRSTAATAKWWHPYHSPYSPGLVLIKRSFDNLAPCPSGTPFFQVTMTHVVFLRPDGSEMPLYSTKNDGPIPYDCNAPTVDLSRGPVFESRDGSGTWFRYDPTVSWCSAPAQLDAPSPVDRNVSTLDDGDRAARTTCGTLYFRNGTRYLIDMGRVRKIIDRNGNTTQMQYCGEVASACTDDIRLETATDPLGRKTGIDYGGCVPGNGTSCDVVKYKGYDNVDRTIKVTWGAAANQRRPDLAPETLFPGLGTVNEAGDSVYSVVLADGVSAYTFYYNPYGEVARVVLPTGGAIDYDYGQGFAAGPGVYASGQVLDALDGLTGSLWQPFIYRRLLKRRQHLSVPPAGTSTAGLDALADSVTVYNNAETAFNPVYYTLTNPQRVQGLSYGAAGMVTETVTGTGGLSLQTQHSFSQGRSPNNIYRVSPNTVGAGAILALHLGLGMPDPLEGSEIATAVPGLHRVQRAYTVSAKWSPLVCQEVTTWLQNNAFSTRLLSYGTYDNLMESYEYKFSPAGPAITQIPGTDYLDCPAATAGWVRDTQNTYAPDTHYLNPADGSLGPAYLPSLMSTSIVYSAPGVKASGIQNTYDGGGSVTYLTTGGIPIPNLDASIGSSIWARGNVTKLERWLNNGWVTTSTADKYDLAGNPLQVSDGKAIPATTFYDYSDSPPQNLAGVVVGCSSGPTNSHAFATRIANALGHWTSLQWDCNIGKPVKITTPGATLTDTATPVWTTATYADSFDRITETNRNNQIKTAFSYPDILTVDTRSDVDAFNDLWSKNNRTQAIYDGLGRQAETRQYVDTDTCATASYVSTQRQYDGAGRLWKSWNPVCGSIGQVFTQNNYDALGRLTDTTLPGGAVVHTGYNGNIATTTDPVKQDGSPRYQRQVTTDALGRLESVVENGVGTTSYTYNAMDNLTCVAQGTQRRAFQYDEMGRLKSADNPETALSPLASCPQAGRTAMLYTYDNAGNLLSRTDTAGSTISYTPDALNRVASKTSSDGTVMFSYDQSYAIAGETATDYPIGRLTNVTFGSLSSRYRYELLGRYQASQQNVDSDQPYVFHYDHKPAGMATMKYPSGRQVITSYDNSGKPSGLTGYASGIQYAPHGAMQGLTLGNAVQESWLYNTRLQPTCLSAGLVAGQPLLRLSNGYTLTAGSDPCASGANAAGTDNNGNVLSQVTRAGWLDAGQVYNFRDFTLSYGYSDGMNRVKSATETNGQLGWNQQMTYDTWGNVGVASSWGSSIWSPAGYDGTTNHATGTGWSYTAGNLTGTPFATMTYDTEGKQKTFQSAALSVNANYAYDGEGRRVKSTVGATVTTYVYDAMGQLAAEYGATVSTPGRVYVTPDHLGSTRLVTGAGGAVVERHDYAPFGEEVAALGCGTSPKSPRCDVPGYGAGSVVRMMFTGKERDGETGLDYFGARYFSGAQGRFTSPDPMDHPSQSQGGTLAFISNPQNWNKYAYSLNNPLRYVDPDGQEALPPAVRDMLQRFAPSAVTALGTAGRAVSFTQKILGLERTLGLMPPMVVPGPNSPAQEVQQANAVARMTGNDVLLVDNPNQQGFDALQIVGGFVNAQSAIPTELKGLTSANPMAVLKETVDTEHAANGVALANGQQLTGVQMFISAPNMDANAVAKFANGGPLPTIVGRSSVSKVTVTTSNGTVTVQNGKVTMACKKTGSDGSCQ